MTIANQWISISYPTTGENEFSFWNSEENVVVLPSADDAMTIARSAEFDSQIIFLTNSEDYFGMVEG